MFPMLVLMLVISSSSQLNLIGPHIVLYMLCHICIHNMGLTKINISHELFANLFSVRIPMKEK